MVGRAAQRVRRAGPQAHAAALPLRGRAHRTGRAARQGPRWTGGATGPQGAAPGRPRGARGAAGVRNGRDREDGLPRLLPHRRRLHRVVEGAGHPRRARPRLGGRIGGGLGAGDHRPGSAGVRPSLRAVPESRPRVHARLRHRFLRGPPRRGDRLRAGEVRRGPRGVHRHLRRDQGQDGAARHPPRGAPRQAGGRGPARNRPGQQADPQEGGCGRADGAGGGVGEGPGVPRGRVARDRSRRRHGLRPGS